MSFMLAHSNVVVDGTAWAEPVILWISIGMPTGSGKSSLFNYFLGLLRDVREKCGRKDIHPPWTVEESSFEKMGRGFDGEQQRETLRTVRRAELIPDTNKFVWQ